jgi:Flp pilus assembly protein TadD
LIYRYDRPGSTDAAIAAFQKAIALDPKYAPGYAGLAMAFWRKYDSEKDPVWLEKARGNADKAPALDPQYAYGHVVLGFVLMDQGKKDEADLQFHQALKLDPSNADPHDGLARLARQKGDMKTAEAEAAEAVRLRPDDWHLGSNLASIANAQANYEEAQNALAAALKSTPDNFVLHRQLSVIYTKKGDYAKATEELQKCLEIAPSKSIYSNLGAVYIFRGLYQDAVSSLEHARDLGSNDPLVWSNLGDAYLLTDQAGKAREAFTRAVQLSRDQLEAKPNDPEIRSRMAVYLAKLGRRDEAEAQLAWLEKLPSKNADLLHRMALAYERDGLRDQAVKTLEAALKAGYSLEEIKRDPDLAELRKDQKYQRMMARRGP